MPAVNTDTVRTCRARYAALTRDRAHGDPELTAARNDLHAAQSHAGAHTVLNGLEARVGDQPPEVVLGNLQCRDVPIETLLVQAVELLTYLTRAVSDQPLGVVTALRQQVDRVDGTAAGSQGEP